MPAAIPVQDQFVVSIGELLWDVAGNQRHIGGAPFNFAYHCKTLGAKAAIISRVSRDELGDDLVNRAAELRVDTRSIQTSTEYPTGVVHAETHEDGSVSYLFPDECAWDHIQFPTEARCLVDFATVVYFGTLAQRCPVSHATIMAAVSSGPANAICFLDVNLRPPCYSREILTPSLKAATIVKMNADELCEIRDMYNLVGDEDGAAQQLMEQFAIKTLLITRGADGATAWNSTTKTTVDAYDITVADTIGCGDAFCAAFIVNFAAGATLQAALEAANTVGAYVATQAGATPHYDEIILQQFRKEHQIPIGDLHTKRPVGYAASD